MNYSLPIIATLCIAAYSSLFFAQEHQISQQINNNLTPTIPIQALEIAGHTYLTQLIAEVLYIKVAVYYGGLKKESNPENLNIMAEHFKAMSQLHPKMIDIYYRTESALPHRGKNYVKMTNKILEKGRIAIPNEVVLPFFEGFNYLNYLGQPRKAAEILKVASEIPNAPRWIGHLASILMAGEGNIRSGLALLQGMHASVQSKDEKERYQKDIQAFKKALLVQQALNHYKRQHGNSAERLNQLVPTYIKALPSFKQNYYLKYEPPSLSLLRRRQ